MLATTKQLLPLLKSVFPALLATSKKGDNGRIAVIGGSFQFTGAPFYSAISALKIGGDLAHIFCSKSASPSIKSYSPEIIVHPIFVSQAEIKYDQVDLEVVHADWLQKILAWKPAIHAWVIGPGLGRDAYMNSFFPLLIKSLPDECLVIFDADGIYFLSQHPDLLKQLKRFKTILTPNNRELKFLKQIMEIDIQNIFQQYRSEEQLQEIPSSDKFTDFTLFIKGKEDLILSSKRSFIVRTQGGDKRCGGLGDILAGTVAVCSYWNFEYGPILASRIVRLATRVGYQNQGRGLTAPAVVKQLSKVVMQIQSASL